MSYIIKNNTQGAIVARLTDAGRKKLSEGKLNIGLFQLGDSEMCYNCYNTSLPAQYTGLNILQAEHNAQNLLPLPEKNKGHVKYPISGGITSGDTFGPTIPQHLYEEVYNTATARGFFEVPTTTTPGVYTYFSAQTNAAYTLSSNWLFCASAMTGSSSMQITSADCSTQSYTPINGDLISVTYEFFGNDCSQLNYSAASQTLFYQVQAGNTNSAQTAIELNITVDRDLPNYTFAQYSGITGSCAHVRVYPPFSANPMTTSSIYSTAATATYWCNDTLSFNNCASLNTTDTKIWNMNINWTNTVAGVDTSIYEADMYYGSSGYCGSKEYFGLQSNNGQSFTDQYIDFYHPNIIGGTFYYDSFDNLRVVLPSEQKAAGFLHYTNNTTTDFYGEKFALKQAAFCGSNTCIGEAKNFKLHLPWLMWHKKNSIGSGTGTGAGNETILGQTFYVDPPGYAGAFPADGNPHLMLSTPNTNMNDQGLRYYHLWDDNVGSGDTPNRVGKVFPDYKMMVIDDEELLTALSYKSNRSFTLPAPKTEKILAGTSCTSGSCGNGVVQAYTDSIYITYMFYNSAGTSTGLHCNYYAYETLDMGENLFDLAITFGSEFPYLRDLGNASGLPNSFSGTGFEADRLYLLSQIVSSGAEPAPELWKKKDVTAEIPNHTVGNKILATNLIGHTFYLTDCDTDAGCPQCYTAMTSYELNSYITIPTTSQPQNLQFGDEYFFYGTLETDIMATIYEMRHVVQLGANQYLTSTNPTWLDYMAISTNPPVTPKITEIGLFDNENGFPDLMAIAKLQSPVDRTGTQQFTISIDF